MANQRGVVDVDVMAEDEHERLDFRLDEEKASLHGVTADEIARTLRLALTAAGIAFPADKRDATLVDHVPESELARVLVAWFALDYLRDSDAADDTLACERTARALVAGETPAEALTRVWILEEEWDALSENGREAYTIPDVGQEIRWDGREGAVTAVVPAEWLTYLRTMAAEDGLTLHEGEESPVKTVKPAKKPRKKATKPPVPGVEVAPHAGDPPTAAAPHARKQREGSAMNNRTTRHPSDTESQGGSNG
jgi:hypothetical protein